MGHIPCDLPLFAHLCAAINAKPPEEPLNDGFVLISVPYYIYDCCTVGGGVGVTRRSDDDG